MECIFKLRVKLYRFNDEQWKERGIGNCKLMRDRAERRVRFLMRQEKTLKPVGNFISKWHSYGMVLIFCSQRGLRLGSHGQ